MDKEIEDAFAPLKEVLSRKTFYDSDLFHLIGEFAAGASPHYAASLAFHARDIVSEEGERSYTDVVIETYRRAFFDPTTRDVYGTGDIANNGLLKAFGRHIADATAMEDLQHEHGGEVVFEAPTRQQ